MKKKLFVIVIVLLVLVCCSKDKVQWEKARQENTIAAYDNFLKMYPDSSFSNNARIRKTYLMVEKTNTIKAYKRLLRAYGKGYFKDYPEEKFLEDKARAQIERLYFNEELKQGRTASHEKFLKRYPNGEFSEKIRENLEKLYFEEAKNQTYISDLEKYLKRFPQGKFSDEVHQIIKERCFENAESRNAILFYNDFLKRFPAGILADKAKARIEELYKLRHPALRRAKTAKIIVKASFPEDVNLKFEDKARGFLELTGLEVSGEKGQQNVDVTLNIKVRGKAVKARYNDGIYRYTGAVVSGSIALLNKGKTLCYKSFSATVEPSWHIRKKKRPSYPEDAPFGSALDGPNSFAARLIELTAELFGRSIYKSAITVNNHLIQRGAASVLLEKWGKNKPWVIHFLKSEIHEAGCHFAPIVIRKLKLKKNKNSIDVIMLAAKNNKFPDVRADAIKALGIMKLKHTLKPLISFLESDNLLVKEAAAIALRNFGDPQAIVPLIAALKRAESSSLLRLIAVSFSKFKDPRVIKVLIDLLGSKHKLVRQEALGSLMMITKRNWGQDQSKWLKWLSIKNKYKNHRK